MDKPSFDRPGNHGTGGPPTYKQEQYAQGLVGWLREEGHFQAEMFARRVYTVETVGAMSVLIDRMKKELAELKDADDFVDASHRENP